MGRAESNGAALKALGAAGFKAAIDLCRLPLWSSRRLAGPSLFSITLSGLDLMRRWPLLDRSPRLSDGSSEPYEMKSKL
jgi:hypothetical protein